MYILYIHLVCPPTKVPGNSLIHRPFEWGWRAVGLCSPCLRWRGRLCRRQCAAGGLCPCMLSG